MAERCPDKTEVEGSIPSSPTKRWRKNHQNKLIIKNKTKDLPRVEVLYSVPIVGQRMKTTARGSNVPGAVFV